MARIIVIDDQKAVRETRDPEQDDGRARGLGYGSQRHHPPSC